MSELSAERLSLTLSWLMTRLATYALLCVMSSSRKGPPEKILHSYLAGVSGEAGRFWKILGVYKT